MYFNYGYLGERSVYLYNNHEKMTTQESSIGVEGGQSSSNNNTIIAKDFQNSKSFQEKNQLNLIKMSDVETENVNWLWYPYIPSGKITIIQGDPGEGKTFFILGLVAKLTQGLSIHTSTNLPPQTVIFQTSDHD